MNLDLAPGDALHVAGANGSGLAGATNRSSGAVSPCATRRAPDGVADPTPSVHPVVVGANMNGAWSPTSCRPPHSRYRAKIFRTGRENEPVFGWRTSTATNGAASTS